MFFISLQKLFLFSRKSNFRILHFQISWRHQMHKHKTRNTFHWITWEVNTVCWWNLASLCHITKKKIHQKFLQKLRPENYFQVLLCLHRIKHNFYWQMKFLKQATYTKYVIANLSKCVQINMSTFTGSFLPRILWKLKRPWN